MDKNIKIIIIFCVLFFLTIQPVNADLGEIFSKALVSGFDGILQHQTDNMYQAAGLNNTDVERSFTNIMIQPNNFLANNMIQKEKNYTAFWYILFYIGFIIVGGAMVMKEESEPKKGFGSHKDTWKNKYLTIAILAPFVWAIYLYVINWFLVVEYLMSRSTMLDTLAVVPLDSMNSTQYAILGATRFLLIMFGIFRYLIVGIIIAYFLIIFAMYFFPMTKEIGKMILQYGLMLLFGRVIIVAALLVGVGILQQGFLSEWGVQYISDSVIYFLVLLFDVLIALVIVLYPVGWIVKGWFYKHVV